MLITFPENVRDYVSIELVYRILLNYKIIHTIYIASKRDL